MISPLIIFFQYIFIRFVTIPAGFIAGLGKWGMFSLVFGFDIFQMFFFFALLERNGNNTKIRKFFFRPLPSETKVSSNSFVQKMEEWGYLGVAILAALPVYAGGMWSAVIASHILNLKKKKCFIFLSIGSFIGSGILINIIYVIYYAIKGLFR